MEKEKRPLGILLLGGFNFFILGLLSLSLFFLIYQNPSSQTSQALSAEFSRYISGQTLTTGQFKSIILSQIILSGLFLISGWGIINRKEWGRRITLYLSFFMVIIATLSVLSRVALIHQAFLQVIYPGILILYFTGKKAEKFFNPPREDTKTEERQ
jgi:hypothetical protein